MNHRERVLTALHHEAPDRCPLQVSFTPEFADRLRANLRVEDQRVHNPHGGGNTYELERSLGEDILLVSVGWANSYYQQSGDYTDEWGISWKEIEYQTPFGVGHYTEPAGHPPQMISGFSLTKHRTLIARNSIMMPNVSSAISRMSIGSS